MKSQCGIKLSEWEEELIPSIQLKINELKKISINDEVDVGNAIEALDEISEDFFPYFIESKYKIFEADKFILIDLFHSNFKKLKDTEGVRFEEAEIAMQICIRLIQLIISITYLEWANIDQESLETEVYNNRWSGYDINSSIKDVHLFPNNYIIQNRCRWIYNIYDHWCDEAYLGRKFNKKE